MINWEKELEAIFNDPLLADVTAPRKRATSSDRLIAGFKRYLPSTKPKVDFPKIRRKKLRCSINGPGF